MSGFVSSPPAPASPPGVTIDCGTWWPEVDPNAFRAAMRIGATAIPDPRVRGALVGAVIGVNRQLAAWQVTQVAAGRTSLAQVPGDVIGTESVPVILWRRAVHAMAAADLVETHRDVTATGREQALSGLSEMTADDHRRNATHAIRDLRGTTRTAVELI